MFKNITSAVFVTTLATLPVSAQAQDVPPEVVISYADLNLESKAGEEILERRIRKAVEKVCGGPALKINLSFARPIRECVKQVSLDAAKAKNAAVASYNAERLAIRDRKIRLAAR
ncbi:UrcA family protein [Altererythrobacter sp. MF3-039]|uniref:UrcA family protein n=1 Tax=Altererythrobacter sp. MF3-039 TaxID=3252901 RepID=UPI00390CC72D